MLEHQAGDDLIGQYDQRQSSSSLDGNGQTQYLFLGGDTRNGGAGDPVLPRDFDGGP